MATEKYETSGPGPYEVVELGKPYRALILDSGATAPVSLTVNSTSSVNITVTLQPGELRTGPAVVTAGATADLHGYLP